LCNELVVIQNGKVVAKGTPDDLINSGNTKVLIEKQDNSVIEKEISSSGSVLAEYLRSFGLSEDVNQVIIQKEGLEDILIKIMDKES
jgi:ABC-type multidrug transport system ATPase subunit